MAKKPFPEAWSEIIGRNVPYWKSLQPDERARLQELVKVFIAEKHFEGCGGMEITDEVKVTITAQACLLLLNIHHNYYERLTSVLVYPESFNLEKEEPGNAGIVSVTDAPVSGLSSSSGAIALSWPDTLAGARWPNDGVNVVLHEFAHQLDLLDSTMNGAPVLASRAMYNDWARVLSEEYEKLCRDVACGVPTLISAYAATTPAEFFAVVTEIFFEKSLALQHDHPALYEEFKQYYKQDPAQRVEGGSA